MPTRIVKKHFGLVVAYEINAGRKALPTAPPVSLQIREVYRNRFNARQPTRRYRDQETHDNRIVRLTPLQRSGAGGSQKRWVTREVTTIRGISNSRKAVEFWSL